MIYAGSSESSFFDVLCNCRNVSINPQTSLFLSGEEILTLMEGMLSYSSKFGQYVSERRGGCTLLASEFLA